MSNFFVCLFFLGGGGGMQNCVMMLRICFFFFPGDVSCFGQDCYMLAFGVPALLMILSIGTVYNIFPAFTTLSKILNLLSPK